MDNRSPRSRGILGPTPTPLNARGDSQMAPQPPSKPPQIHQQEPPQSQPPRVPVIRHILPPKIINIHPDDFKAVVQRLTGLPSTSTTSSSSSNSTTSSSSSSTSTSALNHTSAASDASRGLISPAARFAANTSNELGTFVGGVGTIDQYYYHHHQQQQQQHQNLGFERPSFHHAGILSPGDTPLALISPDTPRALIPPDTPLALISPDVFSTVGPTDPQDGYWNQQRQYQPPMSSTHYGGHPKRSRSDFEAPSSAMPSGHDMHSYLSRDEDRGIPHSVKDTRTTISAYDRYWNQQRQYQPPMSSTHYGGHPKCSRSDFEAPSSAMPSGHDMHSYLSRDEDRGIPHSVKDTRTIGSAYDGYLQYVQTPSMPSEEADPFNGVGMGRPGGNNMMPVLPTGELMGGHGGLLPPDFRPPMGFGQPDSVGRPSREWMKMNPTTKFCGSNFPETQVHDQDNVEEEGDESSNI